MYSLLPVSDLSRVDIDNFNMVKSESGDTRDVNFFAFLRGGGTRTGFCYWVARGKGRMRLSNLDANNGSSRS